LHECNAQQTRKGIQKTTQIAETLTEEMEIISKSSGTLFYKLTIKKVTRWKRLEINTITTQCKLL
jgi:hypothetical protein